MPDTFQYLRLFIIKYKQWEYQNEWRILEDANTRTPAPKIKRIILGVDALVENKEAIRKYCNENNIPLEETKK
ncbi:MAG: hypothetical protein IAC78_01090 [Firmicutes bacterium]|uniref:Uncharacterized protein n=1 Tax=Candidatus Scatoplasma merdavium TaxID=2840932 RepID=A0A9D9GRA4_9BACL|nr:hypothetical protein [Candidatus Scatoplasma merdavium]